MASNQQVISPDQPPQQVNDMCNDDTVYVVKGSKRGSTSCLHRPESTSERLILDFVPYNCCSSGPGFLNDQLPPALRERGVSDAEWQMIVQDLRTNVQPSYRCCGLCGQVASWLFVCFGFPVKLLYNQVSAYQIAARRWLDKINAEVFVPKGLYAKTQTAILDQQIGHAHRHEEISWMAIATTPEQVHKLSKETHIYRYNEGCPCCGCECCPQDTIVPMDCCTQALCCCGPQRVI